MSDDKKDILLPMVFGAGDPPILDFLPTTVTIYRGTHGVIIDEAAYVPDEVWKDGVLVLDTEGRTITRETVERLHRVEDRIVGDMPPIEAVVQEIHDTMKTIVFDAAQHLTRDALAAAMMDITPLADDEPPRRLAKHQQPQHIRAITRADARRSKHRIKRKPR